MYYPLKFHQNGYFIVSFSTYKICWNFEFVHWKGTLEVTLLPQVLQCLGHWISDAVGWHFSCFSSVWWPQKSLCYNAHTVYTHLKKWIQCLSVSVCVLFTSVCEFHTYVCLPSRGDRFDRRFDLSIWNVEKTFELIALSTLIQLDCGCRQTSRAGFFF